MYLETACLTSLPEFLDDCKVSPLLLFLYHES